MEMSTVKQPENTSVDLLALSKNLPWPVKDIALGISVVLIFYAMIFQVLPKINAYRYNPWLTSHIYFVIEVVVLGTLFAFSLYSCKKRSVWPLIHTTRLPKIIKETFRALLYTILMGLAIGTIAKLTEEIFKNKRSTDAVFQWMQNDSNNYFIIVILLMAITVGPIAEEFFFRGFLFNALKSRLPLWLAACVQAILFAAYHNYDLITSFKVFLIGIGLAIIYERRKDLLSPIIVHSFFNAFWAIPLLILTLQNYHSPSLNWDEARTNPSWMTQTNIESIKQQKNGLEQVQYAINTWGSKGSKQWKKEVIAFNAVLLYFPEDRTACAKALSSLTEIYAYYLRDYRRAIVEANKIQSQYVDQREELSHALLKKAYAYMMLKDFDNARRSYQTVLDEFEDFKNDHEAAIAGIKRIDHLEN